MMNHTLRALRRPVRSTFALALTIASCSSNDSSGGLPAGASAGGNTDTPGAGGAGGGNAGGAGGGAPDGGVFGALAGAWDVTFGHGSSFQNSTVRVGANNVTLSVPRSDQGTACAECGKADGSYGIADCTNVDSRYEITVSFISNDAASGTERFVKRWSGADCDANGRPTSASDDIEATFTMTRTSTSDSAFGTLGGKWEYTSESQSCDLLVENASFTVTCRDKDTVNYEHNFVATGSGTTSLLSGSDGGGVQFSAMRH